MRTFQVSLLALAGWALIGTSPASAQGLWSVTGLSQPGTAALDTVEGARWDLSVGRTVVPGTLQVNAGAQLMLYEPSGAVLVVLGPATVDVSRDEIRDELRLIVRSGRVVLASARGPGQGRAIWISTKIAGTPPVNVEFLLGPGQTDVVVEDGRVAVAYEADEVIRSLSVGVNSASVPLASGQLLTVDRSGSPQVAPLGDWLAQQGLDRTWGRELGVASAQVSRKDVETGLFDNIILWDRYAGAAYVAAQLRPRSYAFEIRQTVQTVVSPTAPTTRGAAVQTQPFPAANWVPALSPAAASVQNLRGVGEGVTAIELNNSASTLLEATGSQGLGFRGLRLLAIPGLQSGVRTVGPPGLGAGD